MQIKEAVSSVSNQKGELVLIIITDNGLPESYAKPQG